MSVFKTRDWWSTTVGEAEEFGHGCLCVANIDNEVNGSGETCDTCPFIQLELTCMIDLVPRQKLGENGALSLMEFAVN